jgi:hypothetical protein
VVVYETWTVNPPSLAAVLMWMRSTIQGSNLNSPVLLLVSRAAIADHLPPVGACQDPGEGMEAGQEQVAVGWTAEVHHGVFFDLIQPDHP